MKLPTYTDVVAAARVLEGEAVHTPLLRNKLLDEVTGGRIFLKAECLQRTGSFKFRGAYNAITQLPPSTRKTGVLACSSGNHAQGVAEAARLCGFPATIVMPADAPALKKTRTERCGAKVIEYDRQNEDRDQIVDAVSAQTGAPIVHPYENFHVIAGQGTAGLEAVQDLRAMEMGLDRAVVCAGGGGLLGGTLLAVKEHFPNAKLHSVEPLGYDDQRRSHECGQRVAVEARCKSICDAIVTPMPGERAFALAKGHLEPGLVVSDEEALGAVAFAFNELKTVVEPGGAVALAALLYGKVSVKGENVLAVLSGGNIDPDMMALALAGS